ncbi:MAG: hypothetical protein KatS3mg047_1452 [Bellilinea sp.]|jgi:hypothetical protein|nr:MAG: hypothetical protein KatS3mg047_1452 [Bellilinea sp.]
MNKTRKDFRLSASSLRRLHWLVEHTGKNATTIIELGIERLFTDEWGKLRARLMPRQDGRFDFVVGGLPLLTIEQKALPRLGDHLAELLSPDGGAENLFGVVVLAAGASESRLEVHYDNIQRLFGPILDTPNLEAESNWLMVEGRG